MRKHKVEVLSTGCPMCKEVIRLVEHLAEDPSAVEVLDVRQASGAECARARNIRVFPAVIIDGTTITFDVGKALTQTLEECEWLREFLSKRRFSNAESG